MLLSKSSFAQPGSLDPVVGGDGKVITSFSNFRDRSGAIVIQAEAAG